MRRAIRIASAVVALMALASTAFAAPVVMLDAALDKTDVTVGDLLTFTITVRHEDGAKINIPMMADKFGEFFIREIKSPEPTRENDMVVERVTYTITTYVVGEVTAPAVKITYSYTDETGAAKTEEIETDPIVVKVHPVAPEDAMEIRDLKAPMDIPVGWKYWAGMAAILLAIAGFVAAGVIYWKRRRSGETVEERSLVPPRPAHEIALEKLAQVERMDLISQGRHVEYYDIVTEALRAYLGSRYAINALDMTTTELLRSLGGLIRETDARDCVSRALNDADMVKFAKFAPDHATAAESLKLARIAIERTTPWIYKKDGAGGSEGGIAA